jgi:hypothetical protein
VAIDAAAVALVGAAACSGLREPSMMGAVVALAWALRSGFWARLSRQERPLPLPAELAFLAACALIGGFNDWNTVVRHRVYSYGVPSDLDPFSSIPAWMLAYWGLILRLVATLGLWPRLGPPGPAGELRGAGRRPLLRLALLLALALATRQTIYRFWDDPWLSWLPFAAALALHAALFPWGPRERNLALIAAALGPLAEAALIQIGGLHRYALGWLLGVPLWIALWWVLAALIWSELTRLALASLPGSRLRCPCATERPRCA